MEDILYLYAEPYDPLFPVVCFDERPCQLLDDVIMPIPMKPGRSKRENYEYKRKGTCCVLIAFEPLRGWRYIQVRKRRTAVDYADFMKELVETHYPTVDRIRLVQDNLNTHTPGSFYGVLPPQEAFELGKRFELHYTPLKGSWLNMAEIELSALSKQCLDRRIGDIKKLERESLIWSSNRNRDKKTVQWKFTQDDARRKLEKLYELVKKPKQSNNAPSACPDVKVQDFQNSKIAL